MAETALAEKRAAATEAPQPEAETMSYREAPRLALAQEMERDGRVFLMGEVVGVFDGSYKVSARLLERFGAER